MSNFSENLEELYLNYDTANILKLDTDKSEIIGMFKEELDYPEDLTKCMLKLKKSYLNSVIMRIKIRQKNLNESEIKNDILNFNSELTPILDKLLNNEKFIKQHDEIIKEESKVEKEVKKIEEKVSETEINKSIDEFMEEWVEKTDDDCDFIKVSELYDNYIEYCTEAEYEKESKSSFKEYLSIKIGKPVNSGYKGYKLAEAED
mgnify:FL=1|tara:strand:- start:2028 stop:2639 length:612 start_codon:yes stop_codon:yes gene_type:complete